MTPMPSTSRPEPNEYAPAFGKYIQLVPEGDVVAILAAQLEDARRMLASVSNAEALKVHPPFAWTIKQVVGHVIDSDRVFGHRAHWLARNGGSPLAGFDENGFMEAVDFNRWPLAELVEECSHVRRANIALLTHLDEEAWLRQGVVNGHAATVRAMAYVMAGHAGHHLEIVRQRLGA
jgi:hypothetical protein